MMSEISIREYSSSFEKQVCSLILNIQQAEFDISISIEDQPDLREITKFYQKEGGNFWIAIKDNSVIGTIALLDIGNNQAALRKMFVKSEFRGKQFNVGQALLNTLIDWAHKKCIKEIFLGTTEKFLAAQRFYEKNGFAEIRKGSLPPSFPKMSVDVKFYKLTCFDA